MQPETADEMSAAAGRRAATKKCETFAVLIFASLSLPAISADDVIKERGIQITAGPTRSPSLSWSPAALTFVGAL